MPVKDIESVKMTNEEFEKLLNMRWDLLSFQGEFEGLLPDDEIEVSIGDTRIIEGERWWVLKELRELIAKTVIKDRVESGCYADAPLDQKIEEASSIVLEFPDEERED